MLMSQLIIFLLGIIAGAGVVWFVMKRRVWERGTEIARLQKEKEDALKMCAAEFGFDAFNRKLHEEKEKRKATIMRTIATEGAITTGKAADILNVSRVSAFRYLEELEQEKKIEQVGAFGREVSYRATKA